MLSLATGPVLHAQQTSGEQSLQRQQQRDATIRQQDIREQQRQRAAGQQQQQATNPILRRQLNASDRAQHQQYLQRRHDEADKYPDLPRPALPPAASPAASSTQKNAPAAPASASSGG